MYLPLLRGLLLGFVAGIPVGPVNAAVIDTAMRHCVFRALAIGLGGAFVDFVYSQLAVLGLGPLLANRPQLSTLLLGLGGVVLIVFGLVTARSRDVQRAIPAEQPKVRTGALFASFALGALITVMNPAALVSWVLLAGTVLADLSRAEAFVAGLGILAGVSIWFVFITWLAHKGRVRLGERAVWVPRLVGVLLVGYGVFLVTKATLVVWAAR